MLPGATAHSDPKGIRTPVTAVKGRCPRPLDDGAIFAFRQPTPRTQEAEGYAQQGHFVNHPKTHPVKSPRFARYTTCSRNTADQLSPKFPSPT